MGTEYGRHGPGAFHAAEDKRVVLASIFRNPMAGSFEDEEWIRLNSRRCARKVQHGPVRTDEASEKEEEWQPLQKSSGRSSA